jgi:hypothetical protein
MGYGNIAENFGGTRDPAEFDSGIWVSRIEIGMDPFGRAAECGPQIVGIIVRKRTE